MSSKPRDKTLTRAGVPKPDLSALTDEQVRAWVETLQEQISHAASLRAYLDDQLNKRRKAAQRRVEPGSQADWEAKHGY